MRLNLRAEYQSVKTPSAAPGDHQIKRHTEQSNIIFNAVAATGNTAAVKKKTVNPVNFIDANQHNRRDTGGREARHEPGENSETSAKFGDDCQ